MSTFRIAGHEVGIELWTRPTDFRGWQLGTERITGSFPGWRLWVGPLHVAVCKLAARVPG